jgi:hypothetical protein
MLILKEGLLLRPKHVELNLGGQYVLVLTMFMKIVPVPTAVTVLSM